MPDNAEREEGGPSRPNGRIRSRHRSASAESDTTVPDPLIDEDSSNHALACYTKDLDEHINATIRLFKGRERIVSIPGEGDVPEWLDWTLDEYSSFFAALSRHSRLRPDLIALDCGRSESDVLTYLDALEQGLAKRQYRTTDSGAGAGIVDIKRIKRKREQRFQEGIAPAAREVSEEWVRQEEELASMVDQLVRQKEQVKEEMETAKRRRQEQRTVKREVKTITDRVERRRQRADKLAELDRAWAQEDWGRVLDTTKLLRLDKLARRRSGGHERRPSHGHDGLSRECTPETGDLDSENNELDDATRLPNRPTDRHGKIAIDNATMKSLLALDRSDQTPEQRAQLYQLRHRKRTRDRTRKATLRRLGLSDEDIAAKGGIDAAYLPTIGKTMVDETVVPHALLPSVGWSRPSSLSMPRHVREGTSLTTTTVMSEDSAATSELRRLVSDETFMTDSLDIINFRRLPQAADGPCWTMPIVRETHRQMSQHLKALILQTILVAEAEVLSKGDMDLAIDASHVQKAMSAQSKSATTGMRNRTDSTMGPDVRVASLETDTLIDSTDEHDFTDAEDDELDAALNTLDRANDLRNLYALQHVPAIEGGASPSGTTNQSVEVARASYLSLLADVGKARRHRHAMRQRSEIFTSIYYRRGLSRRRAKNVMKSKAVVDDSDDAESIESSSV